MNDTEKTYKALRKISVEIVKLVAKTDKDLNKILSMVNKSDYLMPNKEEYEVAFRDEFLAVLSQRIIERNKIGATI